MMEMWTQANGTEEWTRWTNIVVGLDAIPRMSLRAVVFISTGEPSEETPLLSAIRLTRVLQSAPLQVFVANPNPSTDWYTRFQASGADGALVLSKNHGRSDRCPLEDAAEIRGDICPALHVTHGQGVTLSVCGRHRDRLVLARQHMDRWCLGNRLSCPHWSGNGDA